MRTLRASLYAWTEQDRISDDHARRRDASRLDESAGRSSNPFAVRGRCACCRPLIGAQEAEAGVCTDCQIDAARAKRRAA